MPPITNFEISFTEKINPNDINSMQRAENGWKVTRVNEESFKNIITSYPYGIIIFKDESKREYYFDKKQNRKRLKNQRREEYADAVIPSFVIYDIDNDFKDIEKENGEIISIEDMKNRMDQQNIQYAIITTKSHGIKGDHDRYRLFVFLDWKGLPYDGKRIPVSKDAFEGPEGDKLKNVRYRRDSLRLMWECVAEEIGIARAIDHAPLNNFAGKYVPSPKNAYYHSEFSREPFVIKKVIPEVQKKLADLYTQKAKQKKAAVLASKKNENVGTYEWFKENKDFRTVINPRVLFGLDLREVIAFYEREYSGGYVREYESGSYEYVDVKSQHKYSFYISSDSGEPMYHDFNTGESGNIVKYMKERVGVSNYLEAAKRLLLDFKDRIEEMGEKLFLDNPAYYIEAFIDALKQKHQGECENLYEAFVEKTRVDSFKFSTDYSLLTLTIRYGEENRNSFKKTIAIPKEQQEEIFSLLVSPTDPEENQESIPSQSPSR